MFTQSPTLLIFCAQLFIFQTVTSQCVNRIVQGPNGPIELLPNQVLVPPGVPYLQGQRQVFIPGPNSNQPVIVPTAPIPTEYVPVAPPCNPPNVILPNIQQAVSNLLGNNFVPNVPGNIVVPNVPGNIVVPNMIVPNAVESYAPVVMYDNSVANSLANALQLLVVSSLLSNTLPAPYEPPCYNNYIPGINYVY